MHTCVHSIDLQVSYYDQDGAGFWAPKGNYTVRVGDMHTPLIETIYKALPEVLSSCINTAILLCCM